MVSCMALAFDKSAFFHDFLTRAARALVLLAVVAAFGLSAPPAWAPVVNDGCARERLVTFHGRDGQVGVRAGETVQVRLPASTAHFHWFCGGTREEVLVLTGEPFNEVKISRARNGAITWNLLLSERADLVWLGKSYDACDRSEVVRLTGAANPIRAGESALVSLSDPREESDLFREFDWYCGDDWNRVANPNRFNAIQIERAENGAINWVFYRSFSVSDDRTAGYLHNVPGHVLVGIPGVVGGAMPPGLLRLTLDGTWGASQAAVRAELLSNLTAELADTARPVQFQVLDLRLGGGDSNELRTAATANEVKLKYIIHENTLSVRSTNLPTSIFATVTFDIEIVIVMKKVSNSIVAPEIARAVAYAHKTEIMADDLWSGAVMAVLKSRMRATESSINIQYLDTSLNNFLAAPFRFGPMVYADVDQSTGRLFFCVGAPVSECEFPNPSIVSFSQVVLNIGDDSCGDEWIWIWDDELGHFVQLGKGKTLVANVDNSRFEWFCGGSTEPATANGSGWASGPKRTHAVEASRDIEGDVSWSFLDWRSSSSTVDPLDSAALWWKTPLWWLASGAVRRF